MNVPVDTDWHTIRVYRAGTNVAGFQIDNHPVETTTTTVPTSNLPAFLMSFGTNNQFVVDWVRVRSYCGTEAGVQILPEQYHNDAPAAVNDSYTIQQGQTLNQAAPGVLGNDSDANQDAITAILVDGPAHGELTLNANGSFTYVHDTGFAGADSFTYKANDGLADSNVATVSITVIP
jgi:VCBS repeat-containing protein